MARKTRTSSDFLKTMRENKKGTGGNFFSLKKKVKSIGWIHPELGILSRKQHSMIPAVSEYNGKEEIKNRRFNCSGKGCILCSLMDFATKKIEDKEIDDVDEFVLDLGKETARVTWANLTGAGGWQTKMDVKPGYVFGWVPLEDRNEKAPIEIVTCPRTLGDAIGTVIEEEQEELGDEEGDPIVTPYPFRLKYDKDKDPALMYTAKRASEKVAKLTEEIEEILNSSLEDYGVDLEAVVKTPKQSEVLKAIQSGWASDEVSFAEFCKFVDVEDGEDVEDDKDDEDEDDEKSNKKKNDKKKNGSTRAKVKCHKCKEIVTPTKKNGRCPECATELDIP